MDCRTRKPGIRRSLAAAAASVLIAAGGSRADRLDAGTPLWLDLPAAVDDHLVLELPIDGQSCTCELRPTSVRTPGYRLLVQHAGGVIVEHPPGPSTIWRGTILELPDSVVTASLGDHGLDMTIHLPTDAEPLRVEPVAGLRGAHLLHRGGVALSSSLMCGFTAETAPATPTPAPIEPAGPGGIAGAPDCFWTAELAFDADHSYFEKFGSVAGVEQRLNAVVNTLNPWYERDLGITHEIGTIVVRTSVEDDPYSDTTVISALLQEFTDHWNSTMQSVPRDLAQLVSDRLFVDPDSGIEPVGNAFFREVCTNGSYSVVRDVSGLSCAAYVSAHELGHNWGSDHCACSAEEGTGCPAGVCPPAADCFCPGWIMSASFSCATAFNPDFTIPQITAFRDTRTCIDFICPPVPNDQCADATAVADGNHPFTTLGATSDGPPDSVCSLVPTGPDVWFSYEASCAGVLVVDVCGSDFDTHLEVYGPTCPGPEDTPLACADDVCGQASQVAVIAAEGERFLIRVGGEGPSQGSGSLTIAGPTCPDCPTDTNGDGATDVDDLVAVLLDWGTTGVVNNGDVNGSGGVDVDDLVEVILAWGPCP